LSSATARTKNCTELYFRDDEGWLKISARPEVLDGRRAVLNRLLPAFAGIKKNLIVQVEYRGNHAKNRNLPEHG
jgi:hypothetical protein